MEFPSQLDIDFVRKLDGEDKLASFRNLFHFSDPDVCYLDGNSLGRLPKRTIEEVNSFLTDEWGHELVDGWSHWIDQAQTAGDLVGEAALGAAPGQVLVCDTVSVNFYQLCSAAIKARPGRKKVIIDSSNFPTDRYVLAGIAEQFGLELITLDTDGSGGPGAISIDSTFELITPELLKPHLDEDVALLTLQAINYRSGCRQDIKAITELARSFGILVVWDCSHAVGSIQLDLDENGVDLAVGCTYKYGNSGPGSPAWLYVRKELQPELRVPIQGWFAQEKQFEMGAFFEPSDEIRRFQIASPSIIGIRGVEVAFEMIREAGIANIEAKAALGTQLMIALSEQWLAELGFTLATPEEPSKRGGHIILKHKDAKQIALALRKLKKVIPDYREPEAIRLAISPLPTSFEEVFEGFQRLRDLVASGDYKQVSMEGNRVT
ncbi:MAG: kynureninase [Aquiluna sp.]